MRIDDILGTILGVVTDVFNFLIVKPIYWIYKGLKRIFIDMCKHVYGKFIAFLVLILLALIVKTLSN